MGFVGDLARVAMTADKGVNLVYINKTGEIVWE